MKPVFQRVRTHSKPGFMTSQRTRGTQLPRRIRQEDRGRALVWQAGRMNEVIAWAVFAGAWLLVAGPLYQGSVELGELDIDREGIEGIKASAIQATRPDPPSAWWWLLPPVMYVLRRRWNSAFREATFAQLTETQREQFTSARAVPSAPSRRPPPTSTRKAPLPDRKSSHF